jgi:hypothetical protein
MLAANRTEVMEGEMQGKGSGVADAIALHVGDAPLDDLSVPKALAGAHARAAQGRASDRNSTLLGHVPGHGSRHPPAVLSHRA